MEKKSLVFPQTKYYREYLEFKHLRGQNALVSLTIVMLALLNALYMILTKYPVIHIIGFSLGFLLILIFNYALSSYSTEHFYYLKLNKYITSVGLFTITIAMVIYFKSPSFIPLLFVAYAICTIYKDIKILLGISIYFLFSALMLLMNYSLLFEFENAFVIKDLAIGFFVLLFLVILLLSSYIIVKEKTFFYNNIAFAKEKEYRNLELLQEFKNKGKTTVIHNKDYYEEAKLLLKDFSDKIDIPDIFSEKLSILKLLDDNIEKEVIIKDYPNYTINDLKRLEKLLLNKASPLQKVILKIRHSQAAKVKTREIFSATHFQSFNKQSDNVETKILCFVVYYAALKKGFPGMKSISNQELYERLVNSQFYHLVDPKILKIYQENADVFNTIIDEVITEVNEND